MSAHDHEFDDDPPPPARGGVPIWLILVLVGIVTGWLLFCVLGTGAYLVYQRNLARQQVMVMEQEVQLAERERLTRNDRSTGNPQFTEGQIREKWREALDEQVRSEVSRAGE